MSIERTLVLNSEDESINLDVDSFRYSGGINRGYQIEMIAFADKSTSLKGFTGARFEFNYGGQNIDNATIRGFVREIGTSFDNKQNRVQFRIVGKSIISYLGEYYYNKIYGEASVDSIISDMLLTTCNTQANFIGHFRPMAFQANRTQVLSGNALEFFNYQFNSHGFYIVDDTNKDRDTIKVYSQPQDLGESKGYYDLMKVVSKDAISGVLFTGFHHKKNYSNIQISGYDVNKGYAKKVDNNPFGNSHTTGETFFSEDAQELTTRYNASLNSLHNTADIKFKNYAYREADVIELQITRTTARKYWVYESEIVGKVEDAKHWQIETSLKILPIEDKPWYPPLANKPKPMQATGFKYSSDKPIGKFNSLPIKTAVPFNDKEDLAHVRNVALTSSKTGGTFSRPQKDSSVVLMTPDNANEPISLGYSSDASADEHISSKNIQDSGIYSAGGVALNFTRNRVDQDYSKVSVRSNDKQGRVSELSLGGENTATHQDGFTRNTFSKDYPNLEGIIKRSVDSALDIAAGDIELDYSGIEKTSITKKDGRDSYSRTVTADTHLERYFVKSFSENSEEAEEVYDNFITSLKISTGKKDDNYQTTIHWDTDKPAGSTIELDGKTEIVSQDFYAFEKEQTNYDFKIKLDEKAELSLQGDLSDNIQSISLGVEKLKKARSYGLELSWKVVNDAKLTIDGQEVDISKPRVFIEILDSEVLKLEFEQEDHISTIAIKLCELHTITSDLKPLPKADEFTQMDASGIYHESNLEQHIVYADKLIESKANPENDILTWHEGLSPKNFNNLNQAKQQQSYNSNELVKPQSYFDESLQRAKDGKPRLESSDRTGADKLAQSGGLDHIASTVNLPTTADSKILKNMSDRDASVLCELVYEEAFWEIIIDDINKNKNAKTLAKNLASYVYDGNKKALNPDTASYLSKKTASDAFYYLTEYYDHYFEVLQKYKLVSTSSSVNSNPKFKGSDSYVDFNENDYYAITVAYVGDERNQGVYVINRGTATVQNLGTSDLDMYLKKSPKIFDCGIAYPEFILRENPDIKNIGFSGHSLGGSITQAQVVCFDGLNDKNYSVSISKNFEPFGIGAIISRLDLLNTQKKMLDSPSFRSQSQMDALALNASNIAVSTTPTNTHLRERYKGLPSSYRGLLVNFYRVGDGVAEQQLNQILGDVIKLDTNYSSLKSYSTGADKYKAQTKYNEREHSFFEDPADRQSQAIGEIQYGAFEVGKDKFYIIHTMMNYKFQGYNDKNGSLLDKEVNETNAGILAKGTNQSEKTRYNLVFNAMKGFEEL